MKPPFVPDYKWAEEYFQGKKKHKNYAKALDVYWHLSFHFDGYFRKPWNVGTGLSNDPNSVNPYFQRLIDDLRPSESIVIKNYRRDQYQPITKVPCGKVINCLKKIVKSSDWKISYDKSEKPESLPDQDSLYDYCEKNFPKDDSIENWAYKNLVRWMLLDPNALVCVMPLSWEVESNEYLRPYPHVINCKDVYEYKENEYAVFLSPYKTENDGKIVIVVTTMSYYELREKRSDRFAFDVVEHKHGIGEMPAWIMGGESKSPDYTAPFYESFVQSMLPSLDTVAGDVSNLAAEKVLHLFSLMWHVQTSVCNACQGVGTVIADGAQTICTSCNGRGAPPLGAFNTIEINPNSTLKPDINIPTPPAGYVQKDISILREMREIVKDGINDALAAVNMEHLMDTPLAESGVSKAYDSEETNNFVYSIAYHLVAEELVPIYYFINELRYSTIVPDKEVRGKMLPHVNIPEHYDFLTQADAEDKLIKITSDANGISDSIKDAYEMQYANAAFQDNVEVLNKLNLIHDHNPLPGYSIADIQTMLTAGIVTKEDAVLSANLKGFINEVLSDSKTAEDFMALDWESQHEKLVEMATELSDKLTAEAQIKQRAQMDLLKSAKIDAEGNPIALVGEKFKEKKPGQKPAKRPDTAGLDNA